MRFGLQVFALSAGVVALVLQVPRKAIFPRMKALHSRSAPTAAYVVLDEKEYANRMKLARMAWQVRARASGRLDLEDGTPLKWEDFPPPSPMFGFPAAPPPPTVCAESRGAPSLAPPSVADPPAAELPPLEDRRRESLLDISPYRTLDDPDL